MNKEVQNVLVLGASPNPARYSNIVTKRLHLYGHQVVPYGKRKGEIDGATIVQSLPESGTIDTVTMYLGAPRQAEFYEYLLDLKPKRIIFNPGAENYELSQLARGQGIEVENACTLVMLGVGTF